MPNEVSVSHHALLIGAILCHLDFLDEQIERLSEAIEEQLAPFQAHVELLRDRRHIASWRPLRPSIDLHSWPVVSVCAAGPSCDWSARGRQRASGTRVLKMRRPRYTDGSAPTTKTRSASQSFPTPSGWKRRAAPVSDAPDRACQSPPPPSLLVVESQGPRLTLAPAPALLSGPE